MAITRGQVFEDFYHPTSDEIFCGVQIKWAHHSSPGSREEPPDDFIEIENLKLITICGEMVRSSDSNELPDWITNEMLTKVIDIFDCEDNFNEDEYDK